MEWKERHQAAIKSARQACGYDTPVRFVTQIVVVIFGIASLWLFGGPNDAWSEILVKSGATAAVILILPVVYLWNLLRIGPVIRRNSAVLLVIVGSSLAIIGVMIFSFGVMQFRSPDSQSLQLQAQLKVIQDQLAALGKSTEPQAQSSTPPVSGMALRREYIGASKGRFDKSLSQLTEVLNGKGIEAVRTADKFLPVFQISTPKFGYGFHTQTYEPLKSNPQRVIELLNETYENIWGQLLRQNPDQLDDLNDVLESGDALTEFRTSMENVVRHFEYFKNIYEKDDERSAIYASALFALLKDPTMKSAQRFNDWISRCNERINAKRERLDLAK